MNATEYKSVIGLDSLYIAAVTQDDAAGYVAGTPEWLAPAADASQEPSVSVEVQYADNLPYDTLRGRGETKVTLNVTGIPPEMLAKLAGGVFNPTTGRVEDSESVPSNYALGFRAMKSNGHYRYFWFLKGSFGAPKEEASTNKDRPDVKTIEIVYTALKTIYKFTLYDSSVDGAKRVYGDADTTAFSATSWFASVQTPASTSISALALSSSVPSDDATGVSRSADITLTFNNALPTAALTNITLLDDAMVVVAAAKTIDTAHKVVTINPNATLAANKAHTVVIAVTDIYGQTLTSIVTFTTGS